jgi:hypothetical protein
MYHTDVSTCFCQTAIGFYKGHAVEMVAVLCTELAPGLKRGEELTPKSCSLTAGR